MRKTKLFLAVLFSSIFLSNQIFAQTPPDSEKEHKFILQMVLDIAENGNYQKYQDSLTPEAYVIYDGSYESLFEVLGNPSKKEKFIVGSEIKPATMRYSSPNEENTVHMVIQTKNIDDSEVNWHSLYFERSEDGNLRLKLWHQS
jgi:hypothetical protein